MLSERPRKKCCCLVICVLESFCVGGGGAPAPPLGIGVGCGVGGVAVFEGRCSWPIRRVGQAVAPGGRVGVGCSWPSSLRSSDHGTQQGVRLMGLGIVCVGGGGAAAPAFGMGVGCGVGGWGGVSGLLFVGDPWSRIGRGNRLRRCRRAGRCWLFVTFVASLVRPRWPAGSRRARWPRVGRPIVQTGVRTGELFGADCLGGGSAVAAGPRFRRC